MQDRLNSAQRLALVAITHCFRTTSTVALQVLAGCLPLDLQVELEFNMIQLHCFPRAATFGNTKIVPDEVQFPLSKWTYHPAKAPAFDWDSGTPCNAGIEVYTDGSRIDGRIGAGVAIYQDGLLQVEESYKLSPWASVYQAELVAIVKGLELLNACNVDAAQ